MKLHPPREISIDRLDEHLAIHSHAIGGKRAVALQMATAVLLFAVCMSASVIGFLDIAQVTKSLGTRDFVEYWAAGQMLVHGENPYDAAATYQLERSVGWIDNHPEISFSPPTVFILEAPLGLLDARSGAILWMNLLIVSLITSVRLIWVALGRPTGWLHLYCFSLAPVLTCLGAGQLGIFMLLGISIFLNSHARHPFLAGTALLVCAFKPHLFLCFGTALLLWAIYRKQFRILAGAAAGITATCAIALCLDRHAFYQYLGMMAIAQPTEHPFVPTLSKMLRLLLNPAYVWLQFVPAIVGCTWAAWLYIRRRASWDWMNQGLLVLVISVGCAPYAWFTDESLLVPSILAGLYHAKTHGRSLLPFALINGALLAELFKGYWITTPYFVWSVPAWFAWYVYASYGQTTEHLGLEPGR